MDSPLCLPFPLVESLSLILLEPPVSLSSIDSVRDLVNTFRVTSKSLIRVNMLSFHGCLEI